MPMHDWTKVYSGLFHDFHQGWSITIRNALNGGLLPKGMSAFVEHKVGVVGDLLTDMPLFLGEATTSRCRWRPPIGPIGRP